MIHIYQVNSDIVRKNVSLKDLVANIPEFLRERALRYKFEADAVNFLLGRLLLNKGLEKIGEYAKLDKIEYHKSGKPFLKDIFFNISHTNSIVLCAISKDGEIGIDVENLKEVKLEDFKPWFTVGEWEDIKNSSSPLHKFYWYWTRKESIIKAIGLNLSDLHKIEIDTKKDHFITDNRNWFLKDLDIGSDNFCAICSETPIIEIKHIVINEFVDL